MADSQLSAPTDKVTKCNKHPEYKAVFEPRTLCEYCWIIWVTKLQDALRRLGGKVSK